MLPEVTVAVGENSEKPLFSQTSTNGSFHSERDVERLHQNPLVGGAIAEEGDRDATIAVELCSERRADRKADAAADDTVRADDAAAEVGNVHRAAAAFADAVLAAEDLGDQELGIAALGEEVTVPAMRAGDPVAIGEMRADADGDRLLADIQVHRAGQLAGMGGGSEGLFHFADEEHLAGRAELLLVRQVTGDFLRHAFVSVPLRAC